MAHWKFTSKKGRENALKRLNEAKEKWAKIVQQFKQFNFIEDVQTMAFVMLQKMAARILMEAKLPVHGYLTVQKNTWVTDEKGDKVVNGIRGYYKGNQAIVMDKDNLLTNGGRDFFHYQDYTATATGTPSSSTTATRAGGVIALSADAVAPAATDTSVASEITTGGLARADATTKTHTVGTNVTTLQNVFTASAVQTNVQKSGLFNVTTAPVSGVLTHENTFTAVTLQINDTLTVTWTLTLG